MAGFTAFIMGLGVQCTVVMVCMLLGGAPLVLWVVLQLAYLRRLGDTRGLAVHLHSLPGCSQCGACGSGVAGVLEVYPVLFAAKEPGQFPWVVYCVWRNNNPLLLGSTSRNLSLSWHLCRQQPVRLDCVPALM